MLSGNKRARSSLDLTSENSVSELAVLEPLRLSTSIPYAVHPYPPRQERIKNQINEYMIEASRLTEMINVIENNVSSGHLEMSQVTENLKELREKEKGYQDKINALNKELHKLILNCNRQKRYRENKKRKKAEIAMPLNSITEKGNSLSSSSNQTELPLEEQASLELKIANLQETCEAQLETINNQEEIIDNAYSQMAFLVKQVETLKKELATAMKKNDLLELRLQEKNTDLDFNYNNPLLVQEVSRESSALFGQTFSFFGRSLAYLSPQPAINSNHNQPEPQQEFPGEGTNVTRRNV